MVLDYQGVYFASTSKKKKNDMLQRRETYEETRSPILHLCI